ncbi:hypothetical protein PG996_014872 [Apiospora saccharicola]|uniref:Uncharacterized protein n=1 Tax=Apiospora saccharicola TaxID=335842 RepID=A0ABR1TJJ9_9PEZI
MFALSEESKVRLPHNHTVVCTSSNNTCRSALEGSSSSAVSRCTSYTRSDPRPSIIRYESLRRQR